MKKHFDKCTLYINRLSFRLEQDINRETKLKKIQDDISNLETIRDKCEVNKKDEIENLKNIQKNLEEINTKHIKINSEIEATKSKVEVLENI